MKFYLQMSALMMLLLGLAACGVAGELTPAPPMSMAQISHAAVSPHQQEAK